MVAQTCDNNKLDNADETLCVSTLAQLGVQKGVYTTQLLSGWRNTSLYVQVDAWRPFRNYDDAANVGVATQNSYKAQAGDALQKMVASGYARRGEQCHNLTTACAARYTNSFFDFVYVDARHDRLGVLEDIATWWSKLR